MKAINALIALLGLIVLTLSGGVHAGIYAGAKLDIRNLRIDVTGVTAPAVTTWNFNLLNLASLSPGGIAYTANSCIGGQGPGPCIPVTALSSVAQANGDTLYAGPAQVEINLPPQSFDFLGPNSGQQFARADSVIRSAQLTGDPATAVTNIVETQIIDGFSGSGKSDMQSSTGLSFQFQVTGPGTFTITFEADPALMASIDDSEALAANSQASHSFQVVLSQDTGEGAGASVTWSPRNSNDQANACDDGDVLFIGSGIECGDEGEFSSENLNNNVTVSAVPFSSDIASYPGTPGDQGFQAYSLQLTFANAGAYTLSMTESKSVLVTRVLQEALYDLGDNPDSYATLLTSLGPRHAIDSSLYLGDCLDSESDGQPGPGADGDDSDNSGSAFPAGVTCSDDEDGIINPADLSFIDGDSHAVTLKATNNTGAEATLNGWIDFNCNGGFDPGERDSASVPSGFNGTVDLQFSAPYPRAGGCQSGAIGTYARFRLSTDPAADLPTGDATNGEVEDYPVNLDEIPTVYDWGDNPDPSYATYSSSGGPSHEITPLATPTLYMGQCVDSEDDGQPSIGANGDDDNQGGTPTYSRPEDVICGDDEDGVSDPTDLSFVDGQSNDVTLSVTNDSGNAALLVGWIDFDCSGTFDGSEQVQANVPTGFSGPVVLPFTAPIPRTGCPAGPISTYARFRLSTDLVAVVEPNGAAANGEVEDYPVSLVDAERFYDLGDNPDSYGTLQGSGGPRHEITPILTPPLYLGQCVDSEADGQPSAGADGDDTNAAGSPWSPTSSRPAGVSCSDDEDGVVNASDLEFLDGQSKSVALDYYNGAGEPAMLTGWIDFDCSGSFEAAEGVSISVPAGSGTAYLNFTAPDIRSASCASGTAVTYARFRLSTDVAAQEPTGDAIDGEVEDYPVTLKEESGGGQGCTPGYWKNHVDIWVGYAPEELYNDVFSVDASFDKDLLGALKQGGGGEKALGRHATAALLNAAHPLVNYLYSTADIIGMVQEAYVTGDYEATKNLLATQNEIGCSIDAHGRPVSGD